MVIDNFNVFRNRLTFIDKNDRYIIHVMRRPKDRSPDEIYFGANEHQRLIRTYYVDNIDYFNKKEPAIKELCRINNARAYILPQVRNNFKCLLNLGQKIMETIQLENYSIKPEHLLRSAYCEFHRSRARRWILDLDNDGMTEYVQAGGDVKTIDWTPEQVLKLVKDTLALRGEDSENAFMVPTKSGCHIVTPPFSIQDAKKKCGMFYEGVRKTAVGVKYTGPGESEYIRKNITGWLHKDGLSLLYYNG